jgi:hypothetical protein
LDKKNINWEKSAYTYVEKQGWNYILW